MKNLQKSKFQLCGNANVNSMVLVLLAILSSCCVVSETNETVSELAPSGIQKCRDVVPECECFDSQTAVILHCWNVSDFEKFNENLYKMNTLYIINIYGHRFLPTGFLRGLNVFGLIVNDTHFQGLEENAFEGVVKLEKFFVFKSSATAAFFPKQSVDIPGGVQPARPTCAQDPLILQQLHRVRRAGRIPGKQFLSISIAQPQNKAIISNILCVHIGNLIPCRTRRLFLFAQPFPGKLKYVSPNPVCIFWQSNALQNKAIISVCSTFSWKVKGTEGVTHFSISHNQLTYLPRLVQTMDEASYGGAL
ncbi:hypothetical protein CEXT_571921 [Caerostris extrusa]|uniref:Uncharacterized protein n=1 Tax=Caerostris extrusa TaxID=172846 RepID=A0AAV4TV67_CAEEX|nr:hypothetical protein CEXT_571921 [Caerostris extrusa]